MKKKLIIDARFWGPSHTGLGRYTQSLVKALEKFKIPNLKFSLLVNKKIKSRFDQIKVSAKPYSIKEQLEIPKVLNQHQPDLVHFLHFNVPLFIKQPFIVTIHDLIKHHSSGFQTTTRSVFTYPIKRLAYFITIKKAVKNSQHILTPSNWVKKDIQKHYRINPKKIIITKEAADDQYFNQLNSKFKIPQYSYLIYVGNAYPHKNLIQLIKAVKKTKLKLIVVTGRDIFYQRLRKQIRNLKAQSQVKLKDFTSDKDLKKLYQNSIAFITASLFEGFGLPGLEAMASGTLVLTAKRASMPEIYQDKAIYFNPRNLHSIVKAINKAQNLTKKKRQLMIKSGQKYAQTFSWQKTASETIKTYENCLSL